MFYTYLWLRYDGTPYYVGKGIGRRAFTSWAHGVHKPVDKSRIIVQEFLSETDAFIAERFLIDYYGRLDLRTGCLRNLTNGGEGPSGVAHPSQRGAIRTKELRNRISATLKRKGIIPPNQTGFHHSEETRKRISAAMKEVRRKGRLSGNKD